MHTIIGHDDPQEYREDYHGLLAHGMMGFYALDLKSFIQGKQDELGVECEFVPLHQLNNQGVQIPRKVLEAACDAHDGLFIGIIRTQENQETIFWVTGEKFDEHDDGSSRILPSGCYRPNRSSLIGEEIRSSLERALSRA